MKYLSYSVLATALFMSGVSHATNTITFTGKILDATCDVAIQDAKGTEVSATGSGDVKLDDVSKSDLSEAGSVAGPTRFSIIAKNCDMGTSGKTKISANFTSVDADNLGYLNNKSTGANAATKVQFKLLDADKNFIKVNDPNQENTTAYQTIVTEAPAETVMPFYVEYYSSLGGATGGDVTGSVNFELMYK
ncbi:fimbrial protein [Citrobacter amalonaticus]|uniref:fimbrial protein n=1 Tax=Citrobacter amalonaticus TaxID=35703 RepID=UPI00207D43B5|nr:fimbrial protein [Citrobacter amalonaticus]MCO4157241.1 type 1 fimbrial protein [Citrobacter amalonaticus]